MLKLISLEHKAADRPPVQKSILLDPDTINVVEDIDGSTCRVKTDDGVYVVANSLDTLYEMIADDEAKFMADLNQVHQL